MTGVVAYGGEVIAAPDRPPDWTLRFPHVFLVEHEGHDLFNEFEDATSLTHAWVVAYPSLVDDHLIVQGWYGDDRRACVDALRPMMEAFDAWRRRTSVPAHAEAQDRLPAD